MSVSMHKGLHFVHVCANFYECVICVCERIVVQKPNRVLNTTWNIIQHASQDFSVAWSVLCYFPYTFIRQEVGFQCKSSLTCQGFWTLVLIILSEIKIPEICYDLQFISESILYRLEGNKNWAWILPCLTRLANSQWTYNGNPFIRFETICWVHSSLSSNPMIFLFL